QDGSAQRLAASQEKSRSYLLLKSLPPVGAQRLAASQEKSRGYYYRFLLALAVLNASRHHRKNRSWRPEFETFPRRVLNASRPHTKNRRLSRASRIPAWLVLNASRHHRKNRLAGLGVVTFFERCSTPRGITGKIASSSPLPFLCLYVCAQRL